MKNVYFILFILTAISFLQGCEKSDENINKEALLASVENIKASSATINVTHNFANQAIVKKGVWHSTTSSSILKPQTKDYIVSTTSETNFSIDLNTLNAGTTYFLRPYAIYATDTVFGEEIKFTTDDYLSFNSSLQYGSVTDIDGNKYKTIQIGDQVWMAENLRVTHYRNGDPIMTFANRENLSSPIYYWYDNSDKDKEIYGAYYNWAAATDERHIAPEGWRVATKSDWEKLFKFTGNKAASLQEVSTAHWKFDDERFFNINSNGTGFTAVSAGVASHPIYQGKKSNWTSFWASDSAEPYKATLFLYPNETQISVAWDNSSNGYSIRCIKE